MRRARPRMQWDDPAPVSTDGTVVFHASDRETGLHIECVVVRAYQGRLRAWADRGSGSLVHDEVVPLTHDLRDPVDQALAASWVSRCRESASTSVGPKVTRSDR